MYPRSTDSPESGSVVAGLWQTSQYSTSRREPPCSANRTWQAAQFFVAATSLSVVTGPPFGTKSLNGLSGSRSTALLARFSAMLMRCVSVGS